MAQQDQGPTSQNEVQPARKPRGFAAMNPELQRQIASKGGKAAHIKGTAHEFTSQEAAEAGRKGGEARAQNQKKLMEQKTTMPAQEEEQIPTEPSNPQFNRPITNH